MFEGNTYRISFDKVMLSLFCLYAFSLPFELILEILFDIDTIFKPFRIISLMLIAAFILQVLKQGFKLGNDYRNDIFLYAIFIYGLLVSLLKIIGGVFHLGLFFNDIFQTVLYLATFFIYKTMNFSLQANLKVIRFFVAGIFVNSLSVFYDFFFKGHYERGTGFTDNPNYVALGLIAAMTFFMLRLNQNKRLRLKIRDGLVILLLLYVFVITGSRTGLIMLVVVNLFIFIFSSLRIKLSLLFVSAMIVLFLLPQQLEKARLGGPLILIQRLSYKVGATEDVRFRVWQGVFNALEEEGYMGMGIGQYKANFPKYFKDEPNKIILEMVNRGYYLSTHNDYLAILTDYGLPGLLFYLIFLFLYFKKIGKKMLYPKEDDDEKFFTQYNFIIFTCLIIFGMAAENFQHQLYWFLLMFVTKDLRKNKYSI